LAPLPATASAAYFSPSVSTILLFSSIAVNAIKASSL
jgi:hypothetical protein